MATHRRDVIEWDANTHTGGTSFSGIYGNTAAARAHVHPDHAGRPERRSSTSSSDSCAQRRSAPAQPNESASERVGWRAAGGTLLVNAANVEQRKVCRPPFVVDVQPGEAGVAVLVAAEAQARGEGAAEEGAPPAEPEPEPGPEPEPDHKVCSD